MVPIKFFINQSIKMVSVWYQSIIIRLKRLAYCNTIIIIIIMQ